MKHNEHNDLIILPDIIQLGKALCWFLLAMVLSHVLFLVLESQVGMLSYYYPEQITQLPLLSKLLS